MSTRANNVFTVASSSSSSSSSSSRPGLTLRQLERAALSLILHMEGRADVMFERGIFDADAHKEQTTQCVQRFRTMVNDNCLDFRSFSAVECADLLKEVLSGLHALGSATIKVGRDRKWATPPVLNRLVTLLARVSAASMVHRDVMMNKDKHNNNWLLALMPMVFGINVRSLSPSECQQACGNLDGIIKTRVNEFELRNAPAVRHTYRFGVANEPVRAHTIEAVAPADEIKVCGATILPAGSHLRGDALKRAILKRVDICLLVLRKNP